MKHIDITLKHMPYEKKLTVKGCARCGEDHLMLPWFELSTPIEDADGPWTHWFICPTKQEPILSKVIAP